MQFNIDRNKKGFTIIEVLIVLAIAGLILLIVFLAVPALQRNSRNTQMKNAAASVMAAINEHTTNNNGALPSSVEILNNGDIEVDGDVIGKTQGGYEATVTSSAPGADETGLFHVVLNSKCDGNSLAGGTQNRAVAVLYNIETSDGTIGQCVES